MDQQLPPLNSFHMIQEAYNVSSFLFNENRIGKIEIKNRFVNSATYESMAEESGEVTDELINKGGEIERVACVSCNRCLAGVANEFPIYCYNKRFPESR